MNKGVELF